MKKIYTFIALILFLISCTDRSSRNGQQAHIRQGRISKPLEENPFEGLRRMAFSVTPEQLERSLPANKTIVYGVIMDWHVSNGIATIVSFETGDASLYLSSGGGVLGGKRHQNINIVARRFVTVAQHFLSKAVRTQETPLPLEDEIKFYLLTNKGIYVGQTTIKDIEDKTSDWLQLFTEGNNVITELKKTAESRQEIPPLNSQ